MVRLYECFRKKREKAGKAFLGVDDVLQRAARRLAEIEEETLGRPRETLSGATEAFQSQHAQQAPETKWKYNRVLTFLNGYCARGQLLHLDQVTLETLDGYALWRNKTNWTWIKEIEILSHFFAFCIDREWTRKNPVKALKRPTEEAARCSDGRGLGQRLRGSESISCVDLR